VTCDRCRYFTMTRGSGPNRCTAYDFEADPAYTCDTFETPRVTDDQSRRAFEPPPLPEGQPSIDNTQAGGFARRT
jgi:hypothetical protein